MPQETKEKGIKKEYRGQFPSKNCECHFQEPYGFVPEADCPEHDTKQFTDFLNLLKQKRAEEIEEELIDIIKGKKIKWIEDNIGMLKIEKERITRITNAILDDILEALTQTIKKVGGNK